MNLCYTSSPSMMLMYTKVKQYNHDNNTYDSKNTNTYNNTMY